MASTKNRRFDRRYGVDKTDIALSFLVVLFLSTLVSAQTRTKPANDRVTITPRKITIIRTGEVARNFPHRRKAVVAYPVISTSRSQTTVLCFSTTPGFPHVIQALQPDGRYKFTYKELKPFLKPDGLLWQFVG